MEALKKLWSRKLAIVVVSSLVLALAAHIGLDAVAAEQIHDIAIAGIFGFGAVDVATAIRKK